MLKEATQHILDQLPEETKLSDVDIAVLKKNSEFILSHADGIIIDFYDTLFNNPETKKVFHEGERDLRERSLKLWFEKTLSGNFDLDYWAWQTFVGILHVKRKVTNNMMIAMMGRVSDLISTTAITKLDVNEAIALKNAWSKFSSTVLSLIGEGYHIFYMKAVSNTTGLSDNLLKNTVKVEIDNLIDQYKGYSRM